METLRNGDTGVFVSYLQLALTRAGYTPGDVDGIFGTRTLDALSAFQRENGLSADGIAGRLTWARLYPYLSGYTMHKARQPDTFSSLASKYETSVSALVTANPDVEADDIPVGGSLVIPLPFSIVPDNVPYSYALNTILIDGLAARYPFISEGLAGSSSMGKRLETVSIGHGSKQVFYNASHHANEWITSLVLLHFLENYAKAYAAKEEIAGTDAVGLFNSTTLYLLPLVNPDGVDLVTGALPVNDSYYRQAKALSEYYPSIPFPMGWKANIAGVDLNLGYPAGWEQARKIKFSQGYTRPGPRDYVGSAPLAEPENRAVYSYTKKHDFLLTLSYHTQGNVIFYKYLNYDPPRATEIAGAFARASGYEVQLTPYNSGFAGYKDWFIQTTNRPGYTIEAGLGESPLPLSQFPSIYRDNEGILTLGMALS
ncbi:MAG: M14 family metallopeptidase [Clostridia bacterium]